MTQKTLSNFSKLFVEYKTKLLDDEIIRKLLFYDSPDALERVAPTKDKVQDYIFVAPVMESGITDFGRNTYIMLDVPNLDLDDTDGDGSVIGMVYITPVTSYKYWMLNDNKMRLFEIAERVLKDIDDVKFSPSGKSTVMSIERVLIDKQLYGYAIKVVTTDDSKKGSF